MTIEMTSKKVFELVAIFEQLPSDAFMPEHLNMEAIVSFYDKPSCNTPRCHAGWFYVASHMGLSCYNRFLKKVRSSCYSEYGGGVEVMTKHFGGNILPQGENELCSYFRDNPILWGNNLGQHMFHSCSAFGFDTFDGDGEPIFASHC